MKWIRESMTQIDLVDGGKKLAYIAECRCAQKRIHQRMGKHVGVGMTVKTKLERYLNAADYQTPALCQTVYVISVTDPHHSTPLSERIFAAR